MSGAPGQFPAAGRLAPAYLALLAAGAALSLWLMHSVPLLGDEIFYATASRHLARALRAAARLDFSAIVPALVTLRSDGWFMPGMPVLLLPATLFFKGPTPVWALRLCALALNVLLLALIGRLLTRRLSAGAALVFLGVTLLSPYYVSYLSALWGDSVGILLVLLFVLWCDGRLSAGRELPPLRAGALIAGIVYVRSLFLPLLPVYSAAVLVAALRREGAGAAAALRWARQTLIACAVFFALLAPWSAWQSQKFGFTLTTNSAPLSQLRLFGSARTSPELRAGRKFEVLQENLMRKSRDRTSAAARPDAEGGAGGVDSSYMEEARAARDAALRRVSAGRIVSRVGLNLDRYYLEPAGRLFTFVVARFGLPAALDSAAASALFFWATLWWFAVLLFGALALLVPCDVGRDGFVPALFFKALVFIIGFHPFYVSAHNRYHLQFFPLVGLLAAFLAARRFTPYGRASLRTDTGFLVGAGQVLSIAFAVATFGLLVAY